MSSMMTMIVIFMAIMVQLYSRVLSRYKVRFSARSHFGPKTQHISSVEKC